MALALVVCGEHEAPVVEQPVIAFAALQHGAAHLVLYDVDHALPLPGARVKLGARDRVVATVVHLDERPAGEERQPGPCQQQAHAHLPVVPPGQLDVPGVGSVDKVAAHDVTLRGNDAMQDVARKDVAAVKRQFAAGAVGQDQAAAGSNHVDLAALALDAAHVALHQAGLHHVVAVEKHHPVGRGMFQTAVASCTGCVASLLHDQHLKVGGGMGALEVVEHLQRVVVAAVVHEHQLQGAVGLRKHAVKRAANHLGAVIHWYDDTYLHRYYLLRLQR